jgi:antitoxin (DNA-binding transcriptional repressor) of toxin-antitoxin stability system
METITIHKAKTELSRLIERACRGQEIPAIHLPHFPIHC